MDIPCLEIGELTSSHPGVKRHIDEKQVTFDRSLVALLIAYSGP